MGCGYDTFVFSLMANKEKYCSFSYFELDLQEVVQKKVKYIRDSQALQSALRAPDMAFKGTDHIVSSSYGLAPCDVTDIPALDKQLKNLGIDVR